MIASRFTSFTENFVIYCYQVTKVFCSRYCFTRAFPARSPCDLGSVAYFTISVFREVSKDTVFFDTIFLGGSESESREVLDLIGECGDKDQTIILKTDRSSTMCAWRGLEPRRLAKRRPLLPEVRTGSWNEQFRLQNNTLKSQLDERYGARIDTRHPILPWLCDYSMHVLNRMEVSKDGKTAYERCKGKRAKVLGLEFGEKVLWKHRQGESQKKRGGMLIISSGCRWSREIQAQRTQTQMANYLNFDVKQGPGTRLTEGEKEDVRARENLMIVH